MATPILTTRAVITAKVEATYNTDSVPSVSADAILVMNPSWANEGLRMNERPVVKETLGMKQHVFGGTLKTITMDVEMKGSGVVDTAPDYGVLLEGCGFNETIPGTAGTITYIPTSTFASQQSLTIWYYQNGLTHKLTGCRGNVSFNFETGAIPVMSFTFTGHSVAPIDLAISTPTFDATSPVAVKGNSFTIDGFGAVINALAFDMGNTIATPPDMGEIDGYGQVIITQRDLNGSFDPEMDTVANEDFYGNFLSGKSMALATGTIGSTLYNTFSITMPAVYYRDAAMGDRDGIATYEMPFGAVESSGDDEITISLPQA